MNRRRGIRWHLFQVHLASIVPLGVFAAALLYFHWQAQDHERQRSQLETVRLLAATGDNALDTTVERLAIFARWAASAANEETIREQARDAVAANADWSSMLALDANGRAVFHTDANPAVATDAAGALPEIWLPVFTERRPVISDLLRDPVTRRLHVAVGVPVMRDEEVVYAVIANLELSWYDRLLAQTGAPDGAVAAFVDRNAKFIARSNEGEQRRGTDPSPDWVADTRAQREAINRYVNLNGTSVYTAWTVMRHGWTVGVGTPSAPIDDAFWHHLLVLGFFLLAAIAVGTLHAFTKGRVIAASLQSFESQAQNLATGGRIEGLPDSRVEEVNRAMEALEKASALLQATMRERDRSLETEREARAVAEAASRAKDEFLAMLGHELRNPLAAIMTAATIVKAERRTPAQLEFATGVIERQSQHLKRLIDDLLDVGRAMTGKIVIERKPVDLCAAARHVVSTLRTSHQLADRRVDVDVAPAWVEGDQTRIEQIFTNLLVNAARYTQPGGRIGVRVAREGGDAVIEVVDDGQGIASEDLPRVFELFFQAPSEISRAGGGLGIGLTLVRRLARLHGGDATAFSAGRGTGATLTVRLPAIAAPGATHRDGEIAHGKAAGPVLVVEDNADTRESLAVALELAGYRVLQASDGSAALDTLRAQRPPIAVLDVGLPGLDGYELARRARAEFGSDITLIALTSYGTARDADDALRAGFDRHLTKPIDIAELTQVIERESRRRGAVTDVLG